MKLTFIQKSVYGKTVFYPENEAASSICLVAGRKVLTLSELNILNVTSCFSVEIVAETVSLKTLNKNADNAINHNSNK